MLGHDAALLQRYHRTADESVRDELVQRFLPLARALALRYRASSESIDDLIQVASLGLVKALQRFDPDRGSSFQAYAIDRSALANSACDPLPMFHGDVLFGAPQDRRSFEQ